MGRMRRSRRPMPGYDTHGERGVTSRAGSSRSVRVFPPPTGAGRGFLLAALALACADAPPAPPNLVLIIGDDHGYTDFGFMGSEIVKTPRLDRLAAEGVVFRVGYSTASLCRPALRTLLTGLEPMQYHRL